MAPRVLVRSTSLRLIAAAFAVSVVSQAASLRAQSVVLDSFESPDGVSRWVSQGTPIYLKHEQSTIGATAGSSSMLLELEGGYIPFEWGAVDGWAIQGDFLPTDTDLTGYNAFSTAAENPSLWNLLIDVTTNAGSWTNAQPVDDGAANRAILNVGFNSDGGFGSFDGPNLFNAQGKTTIVTRLSTLTPGILPNSSFYQIQLGGSNRFLPGDPATGVKYYIDRVRLKPVSFSRTETLWSFETPDNPATPNVNEAFEGWDDLGLNQPAGALGDRFAHHHSISTYGATQGTKSLMLDTTGQNPGNVYTVDGNQLSYPGYAFHWGSTFRLNADTDPGEPVVIDPAVKTKIDTLASKLNAATAIQFDVTYSHPGGGAFVPGDPEPFFADPAAATYAGFEVFLSDNRGVFFQYNVGALTSDQVSQFWNDTYEGAPLKPERTFTVPLALMGNVNQGTVAQFPNAGTGFPADLTAISMGFATNADGPIVAHIDNIRLVLDLKGDFNFDGVVNGADLNVWKTASAAGTEGGDADNDGDSDGADFMVWQRELGLTGTRAATAAAGGVPEPASLALVACGLAALGIARRRS